MIFRGCPSRVLGLEFAIGAVLRTLLVGCGDPAMGDPGTASVSRLIWDSAVLVSSTDETPTRKVVDIKGLVVCVKLALHLGGRLHRGYVGDLAKSSMRATRRLTDAIGLTLESMRHRTSGAAFRWLFWPGGRMMRLPCLGRR